MRRLLVLSLALVVLGASAGAKTVVAPAAPKLRGAQSAVPLLAPAKPNALPVKVGAGPLVLWTAPGVDAAQCRRSCAQTRYFCDANDGADDCASTWSQCSAACASPNITSTTANGADN